MHLTQLRYDLGILLKGIEDFYSMSNHLKEPPEVQIVVVPVASILRCQRLSKGIN